jgi:isochorismate hydrolase
MGWDSVLNEIQGLRIACQKEAVEYTKYANSQSNLKRAHLSDVVGHRRKACSVMTMMMMMM